MLHIQQGPHCKLPFHLAVDIFCISKLIEWRSYWIAIKQLVLIPCKSRSSNQGVANFLLVISIRIIAPFCDWCMSGPTHQSPLCNEWKTMALSWVILLFRFEICSKDIEMKPLRSIFLSIPHKTHSQSKKKRYIFPDNVLQKCFCWV